VQGRPYVFRVTTEITLSLAPRVGTIFQQRRTPWPTPRTMSRSILFAIPSEIGKAANVGRYLRTDYKKKEIIIYIRVCIYNYHNTEKNKFNG